MPDVVLCDTPNRAEADLVVAILADEGIHAVAFDDIELGHSGEVMTAHTQVRVLPEDFERAQAAIAEWNASRAQGIDPRELERQALEAGGDAEGALAASGNPTDDPEDDDATVEPSGDREARPAIEAPSCPHCGAPVPEGAFSRLRRAFTALRGRSAPPRGERLCTACGHRWT